MITPYNKIWDLLTIAAGILLALSFSPYDYFYLAIISLAILFASWQGISATRALWRGYLFGAGQFGLGVCWVYVSVHDYGGASIAISVLINMVYAGFLALFPALVGYLSCQLIPANFGLQRLMLMPLVWMLVEYVRGTFIFNGFPWLQIAYSQLDTPLSTYIPMLGSYAVGLILATSAAVVAFSINQRGKKPGSFILVLVVWLLGWYLQDYAWTQTKAEPITVTMIQGNITQEQKWRPENRDKIINRYLYLTEQHWDSDLIIWPETSIPAFLDLVEESVLQPLSEKASAHNTDVIVSLPMRYQQSKPYYNSALLLGKQAGVYQKIHLLPFGEYMPLQPLSGFLLDSLNILPIGSFAPGNLNQPLLSAAGHQFSTSICYEDVMPYLARKDMPEAAFLVNITNDGWFGNTSEPHQHMQIARMRALETGRFLLRATNTGLSGVIAPNGKIIQQAPLFQETTITTDITPMQGMTPYTKIGDLPVVLFLICLFSFLTIRTRLKLNTAAHY